METSVSSEALTYSHISHIRTNDELFLNDFRAFSKPKQSENTMLINQNEHKSSKAPQMPIQLEVWEKWYISMIRISSSVQCLPLQYDESLGLIRVTKRKMFFWIWFLRLTGYTMDNIYLLSRSKKVTVDLVGEKEFFDFWQHTVSRVLGGCIIWAMVSDIQATVQILNTMITTSRIWNERFGIWGDKFSGPLRKALTRAVKFTTIFAFVQEFFPSIVYLQNRQSIRYWGSEWLPDKVYNSYLGIFLFAGNDFMLSAFGIQNACYIATLLVAYFVLTRFWTTNIMEKIQSTGKLTSSVPLYQYRCLLVFSRIGNCCIGKAVVPSALFLTSYFISVMVSVLIRIGHKVGPATILNLTSASALLTFALYLVFGGAGNMLGRSKELKRMLIRDPNLYRRKYIASCREMRMYVGSFFYVKEGGFLGCMRFVVDQAITLIFTF